jgi:hypothetical protein
MTDRKTMFRRVLDALIEGRQRQAERAIEDHLQARAIERSRRTGR